MPSALGAKTSATTVGMVDWKTIAPVMLPIASVSLPCADPDDRVELLGQLGRDRRDDQGEQHRVEPSVVARCSTASTKATAPTMISPSAKRTWTLTTRSRGTAGSLAMGAAVEAMEAQRREVLGVDVRVGLEVALDVPGVDADQDRRPRSTSSQTGSSGRNAAPMASA